MEDENLHNQLQMSFRPDRGTTHAIALITEKIAQNKSEGGKCQVVLRFKAFDKVKIQNLTTGTRNCNGKNAV